MTNKGRLFIVSGPSGVGKDTVLRLMLPKLGDRALLSVSKTTRAPRGDEKDGVDYYFVSDEDFRKSVSDGKMLEFAEYCNICYGTPLEPVDKAVKEGKVIILEIEREGMLKVKKRIPDAVSVFIAPPSFEVLESRIRGRRTDSEAAIEKRLEKAKYELEHKTDYDYVIVNDELDKAVDELLAIVLKYID